jgi:DNA-directed RNA polymerase subunit RPC12/RpoP
MEVKTMKYYSIYKCIKCKKEEILINEDLKNIEPRCAYCSSKKVIEEGQYDNLKECLKNKEY